MPKKDAVRELRVVFDTNALHTQAVSDLVNTQTRELILANSNHPDLRIAWYLPQVVLLERQYQMHAKAEQFLNSFRKMDAILGFGISLTPEQLAPKIESVIQSQVKDLGVQTIGVDPTRVDWLRLIRDAGLRVPPFEAGDKEKGFRDAVVLESFFQVAEDSPRAPATCRVVLVSGDGLLGAAAKTRVNTLANVEVLANLEELRNLINTLISTVDESFVKELREKATKLFFVPKDQETLYYREKMGDRIREQFAEVLKEVPADATTREPGKTLIGAPRFVRKEHQRIHWLTSIDFEASAYKFEKRQAGGPEAGTAGFLEAAEGYLTQLNQPTRLRNLMSLSGLMNPTAERVLVKKGKTEFNVSWSTTLDKKKKLTRPHIDEISCVGTTWEQS